MTDRKTKRSRVVINDGTWDCSLCTYKNPCVAFRCEMCDSRKGTATRKPKLVVNKHVEQLPRSKRKTNEDYSSDASTTDDSDGQDDDDDDDDDDEEFHHEERKSTQSHQNHTRRSFPSDHFNESISSPASSTTTIQSYRSASPSSSSKVNDHSKVSTTKKRATFNSLSRSTKSASSLIPNRKNLNNDNDQKKSSKHQSSKSKDNKQRQSNDHNQKSKTTTTSTTTTNDRNKAKNHVQQKKKKTKLSSLSSMSSSSSTSSNSSSIHTTTTITVDGVSVRITELINNDHNIITTNDNLSNGNNHPSRASSSSPIHRTNSQLEK